MADRSIVVRLRAEVGQYKQAMTDAGKATQQVGQQAVKSARDNREAWTTAGTALTAYGVGVTALGAALLKTGIAYNTLQQTSRAAMTTLLGSATAANAQMDKLDEFARNSPFAKQTFIQAQQQMLAFGIETQKVLPYLDSVQDAVAAMGGSNQEISEVAFIMSQISAAAKITATDLMQLGQRGINAAELIGSQMDMTGAQVRQAITDGALDAGTALDALSAGMQERFGGAADNVKNTFEGTMDRVKAAWRDFASELAEPLVGSNGGGALITLGNQAADLMRAFQGLPGPVKTGTAALVGLSGVASLVGGAFLLALPRVIETRAAFAQLATDMPRTAAAAGRVGTALGYLGKAAGAAGAAFISLQVIESIGKQFDEVHPGVNRLADDLLRMSEVASGFTAAGLGDTFDDLAESVERVSKNSLADNILFGMDSAGLRRAKADVEAIDEALASIALQEGPREAADAMQSLVDQGYLTRQELELMRPLLTGYDDALASVARSSGEAGDATFELTADQKAAAEALEKSRDAARGTATSFFNLGDSLDDSEKSLGDWIAEMEKNAKALRDFRKNAEEAADRGLRGGLIAALHEAGPAGARRMAELANATDAEIRRANRAWRAGQREVNKYTDEIGGVPKAVATEVRVTGIEAAIAGVRAVRSALSGLGSLSPFSVGVPRQPVGRADGGSVPHDGGPYADRYPYLLAPGEEVISNRFGQADRHRSLLKAINAGRLADGGTARGLAKGGTAYGGVASGRLPGNVDTRIELLSLQQSIRELQRDLNKTGKESLKGLDREIAQLTLTSKRREFQEALVTAERAKELRQMTRLRDSREELLQVERDALKSLREASRSMSEQIAGQFKSDLFGGTDLTEAAIKGLLPSEFFAGMGAWTDEASLRAAIDQRVSGMSATERQRWEAQAGLGILRTDTANAKAFEDALAAAVGKGLDGALFEELARSANVGAAQMFAGMSRAQIAQYERAYAQRSSTAASAGSYAAAETFGKAIADQATQARELRAEVRELRRSVNALSDPRGGIEISDTAANKLGRQVSKGVNGAVGAGIQRGRGGAG